jgi:hypothetical protein
MTMLRDPVTKTRYDVIYEQQPRQWLNEQDKDTRRNVTSFIQSASFAPREVAQPLRNQTHWDSRCDNRLAQKLKMRNIYDNGQDRGGVRAIIYVVDRIKQMVIVKLGWRDSGIYEDEDN